MNYNRLMDIFSSERHMSLIVPKEGSPVSRDGLTDGTYHMFGKDPICGVIAVI